MVDKSCIKPEIADVVRDLFVDIERKGKFEDETS